MSTLVLLAHGSPDPRSGDAVRAAAGQVSARSGREVVAAFLDHDTPRLPEAVAPLPADDEVEVLPLLLSRAFHARVDVPAAVADLGRPVRLVDPLGHPAAVLDGLLRTALGPVVVVAAGTRVGAERAAFVEVVTEAGRRTGTPASAAFATGPGPGPSDALDALGPGAAVLPWLLAPGRLLDGVREVATGRRLLAPHGLLAEPLLEEELVARTGRGRAVA